MLTFVLVGGELIGVGSNALWQPLKRFAEPQPPVPPSNPFNPELLAECNTVVYKHTRLAPHEAPRFLTDGSWHMWLVAPAKRRRRTRQPSTGTLIYLP